MTLARHTTSQLHRPAAAPLPSFQPHLLALAVGLGACANAYAIDFQLGEIEGQFDSSLSVGASWAVRGADPKFINSANTLGLRGESATRTADDNRQNFKKGETFSKIFKGVHDLELKYRDSGVFVRGKYWYDFELKDEHRLFYVIDDSGRDDLAKASGAEFLDAFVYHNYNLGELAGNVRLGKQVVSWGESTFIGNSINSINPIDVAALRRPGAEVKEGLIPVNMFYISQGLTENLNAEAFYQLEWDNSVVDNCGTFFGSDPLPQGCNDRLVFAGPDLAPGVARNTATAAQILGGTVVDDVYMPRLADNDPRDSGQYGVALRWFVPELNDTEFGFYAMNYHSRSPYLSFKQTTVAPITAAQVGAVRQAALNAGRTPAQATTAAQIASAQNQFDRVRAARYFVDYPEDIRLYGVSFQTTLGATAVGGELSYRPNMPLQINTADLNLAALQATGTDFRTQTSPVFTSGETAQALGGDLPGYKRMPVLQAQMTATHFIDQIWGASRLTLVGEVGYNRINGLGKADGTDIRFGRSPVFGAGEFPGTQNATVCATATNPQKECNSHGFYTTDSWGYRVRAKLDYPNVIAGINLSPSLAWSHDVDGWGPNFEEGAKAVSVGLDADYLNNYTASLSYTDFFGGNFNTSTDRDFVSLSFGVNF